MARQLHLDKFEEIIAVGALYRPGPMDMIPSFINRKHGREPIEYDHHWMKEILSETYGIMVYQEQVMQIASKLARYSLGEGDVLRRAMGKKDMDQMNNEREKFRRGAKENDIDEEVSMRIFDKMVKFASYGFNKSHAAAYGYLSYVTAYFKANYPGEWMASLMTCDRDDLSKVAKFIREGQSMEIKILPPDVNEAGLTFSSSPQGIRFAMSGIKGVGTGVVEAIISERERRGHFKDLYQFCKRIDTKKVGKKVIEDLVDAGCFDFTGWTRDALKQSVDPIFEATAKEKKEASAGILSLFSLIGDTEEARFAKPPAVKNHRAKQELLLREKELLGFFLTGHPLDTYKEILKRLSCTPLSHIERMSNDTVFRAAFILETVQVRIAAKTQKKFAILVISDGVESFELPMWSELFEEKGHLLKENQLLYAVLQIEKKDEEQRLSCRWIDDLTQANEAMIEACDQAYDKAKHQAAKFAHHKNNAAKSSTGAPKAKIGTEKPVAAVKTKEAPAMVSANVQGPLILQVDADVVRLSHILNLKRTFEAHRGNVPVQLNFLIKDQTIATIHIDVNWGVTVTPELHEALKPEPWLSVL